MNPSLSHSDATVSVAQRITARRDDLAAVCTTRALAELLEAALSEQIRRSPAPLQSWRDEGPRFDGPVVEAFLVRPFSMEVRGRYCVLQLRAIGALERALSDTGLGNLVALRIPSQKLASARAGSRRHVGRLELLHPRLTLLRPENPALCLLLRMLDGRSRMHAWRSR